MDVKRIIVAIVMAITYMMGFAQEDLFDKYQDHDGVTSVYISKKMFRLCNFGMKVEGLNLGDKINQIDGLLILTTEDAKLAKKIQKDFVDSDYEELMEIKDQGENVKFYDRSEGDTIRDLVMLVEDVDESIAIRLSGKFTLGDVLDIVDEGD